MLETLQHGGPAGLPASGTSWTGSRLTLTALSSDARRALEAAAGPERAVKASTDLVREDDAADQLYILTEGWVCRYKTTRDGSRQIVGLSLPGDVVNLGALMFGRPGYGVRVLSAGRVVALSCDRVRSLAEQHVGIAKLLMRRALVENAILGEWALGLGRRSAYQRVAHLFCELGVRLAGDEPDSSSFDMPLTQEQLADALGLTSVHVNRTMQRLRNEELIASVGRTITLPDVQRLRDLSEFDPTYLHIDVETDTWGDRSGDVSLTASQSAPL